MLTKESLYVILFAFPVYQLLFYTIQLVSFKRKNPSKKYLGLLLLCMTVFLILNALHFLGYDEVFSYMYMIFLPVLLTIAPAYFLYILSITHENHDVNKIQRLILFLPSILFLLLNIIFLGTMDQTERMSLINQSLQGLGEEGNEMPGLMLGFWIGAILLVFGQILYAILKVSKIMQVEADLMRQNPSYLAYLDWRWILGISISVLLFLVINALIEMVVPMKNIGLVVVYNGLMLLTGGITGFLGMKQDTLLNQVMQINSKKAGEAMPVNNSWGQEKKAVVASDFISDAEASQIQSLIIKHLETDKPYLKSDFSMHDLCSHLNTSRRKISYVLNDVMEKNFYGVINEYRIKEAEELLTRDEMNQMKIEVLGEMVGFQSKSSFNACFKKVTGMTPSEYKMKKRLS
jgi:AraC-like DNA-binding protein